MTKNYWRFLVAVTLLTCAPALRVHAMELLADPGFEDPNPIGSDPWRLTFFTPATVITDAMTMPNNGLEHASLTKDHALPNADPQIDSTSFAGFGGAAKIDDFTGLELQLSVEYKVFENSIADPAGTPGTFVRMFLAYFDSDGFLGFGSFANADVFEAGTNTDYVNHSFTDTVPDFGTPVTAVGYNLAVLGQFEGSGIATVFFDDASLTVVPEPTSAGLAVVALASLAILRRKRLRSS